MSRRPRGAEGGQASTLCSEAGVTEEASEVHEEEALVGDEEVVVGAEEEEAHGVIQEEGGEEGGSEEVEDTEEDTEEVINLNENLKACMEIMK